MALPLPVIRLSPMVADILRKPASNSSTPTELNLAAVCSS